MPTAKSSKQPLAPAEREKSWLETIFALHSLAEQRLSEDEAQRTLDALRRQFDFARRSGDRSREVAASMAAHEALIRCFENPQDEDQRLGASTLARLAETNFNLANGIELARRLCTSPDVRKRIDDKLNEAAVKYASLAPVKSIWELCDGEKIVFDALSELMCELLPTPVRKERLGFAEIMENLKAMEANSAKIVQAVKTEGKKTRQDLKQVAENAAIAAGKKKVAAARGTMYRQKQLAATEEERDKKRAERDKWRKRVKRKMTSNHLSARSAARNVHENAERIWNEPSPYSEAYLAKLVGKKRKYTK